MECERFVLFLDVLGFSQLVLNNPTDVLQKIYDSELRQTAAAASFISIAKTGNLERVQFEILTSPQGKLHDIKQDKLSFHVMSDSLVAWTANTNPESLLILSNFAAQYISLTAVLGLPHRGAISIGNIQIIELPLNGYLQSNVIGTGVVNAHAFEGGQDWMGCVIDPKCLQLFPDHVKFDLLHLPNSTITNYSVPYKDSAVYKSDIVVDWRSCVTEVTQNAGYDYFLEQFSRYNKPISNSVEKKVRNTCEFYSSTE